MSIYLWNYESKDVTFPIVDIKPDDLSNINEVITVAKCHEDNENTLFYGSSKGQTKMIDLREKSKINTNGGLTF